MQNDIREPLSVVLMLLQSLLETIVVSKTREIVCTLISQVNMLVIFFNNTLDRRLIKLDKFSVETKKFAPE